MCPITSDWHPDGCEYVHSVIISWSANTENSPQIGEGRRTHLLIFKQGVYLSIVAAFWSPHSNCSHRKGEKMLLWVISLLSLMTDSN